MEVLVFEEHARVFAPGEHGFNIVLERNRVG
jgi:hypothetical protein